MQERAGSQRQGNAPRRLVPAQRVIIVRVLRTRARPSPPRGSTAPDRYV